MADQGLESARIVIAFTGAGYDGEAMAHLVSILEERGHSVELVSYGGLAAAAARRLADRGMRGLKAVLRTVGRGMDDESKLVDGDGSGVDMIVATTPDLAKSVTRAAGEKTLRVGLIADLVWRPEWADAEFDALIVPHPTFQRLVIRRGWSESAVLRGGVPLSKSFSRTLDVPAIRERFRIDPSQGPLLLVMAEGVDPGRLDRIAFQLSLVDRPSQPLFYVGDDKLAAESLRKSCADHGVLARLFGTVDNLEEYYAACDVVVASVDHPLVYALLALDKPMIAFDADSGTSPLAAFLQDEGGAIVVPDILRLGAEIDGVLGSEREMQRLRDGARTIVDQLGAKTIAESIEDALKRRDDLQSSKPPASEEVQEAFGGGGAFEVIGRPSAPPATQPSAPAPANGEEPQATSASGQSDETSTGAPAGDKEAPVWSGPASPRARGYEPRISKAEAKQQMASLIMAENTAERRLAEATRYVSTWERRLDLARQAGEPDLANQADRFLANYRREEMSLFRELDRIRAQKDKLRRVYQGGPSPSPRGGISGGSGSGEPWAPASGSPTDVEGRFRSMELNQDLDRLKDRVRDDFGE